MVILMTSLVDRHLLHRQVELGGALGSYQLYILMVPRRRSILRIPKRRGRRRKPLLQGK